MGQKSGGGAVPLLVAAGSPSNAMSPGQRPISIPSGILIHTAVWPQRTWVENCGGLCPLWKGELGAYLTQCGLGWGLPPCQASPWFVQPFGHNTLTLQTDIEVNGPVAQGETFYKRTPQNDPRRRGLEWLGSLKIISNVIVWQNIYGILFIYNNCLSTYCTISETTSTTSVWSKTVNFYYPYMEFQRIFGVRKLDPIG